MEEEKIIPAPKEGDEAQENPPIETQPQPNNESSVEGNEVKNPSPEEQSKEDNAKFAKMRHEKEVAKAKAAGDAEGYKRARIKSVGGKNPYAGDAPIETDEDYELYEIQDEIKARGGDPSSVLEVQKSLKERADAKAKAVEDAKTEEEKNQAKANKEVDDYLKAGHTREELQAYWKDSRFQEFASDLIGVIPLTTIITKFDKAYSKQNDVKKSVATKISNPGPASNDETPAPQKSIKDMSKEEFKKFHDEVLSGKRKI